MQEKSIVKLLLSLGMAPCSKGFRTSVCAIELILKDPSVLDQITKRLYPEVARELGTTASRAERSIRHAVEAMFEYQNAEEIITILGLPTKLRTGKYTNSEFLSLCALKLRGVAS